MSGVLAALLCVTVVLAMAAAPVTVIVLVRRRRRRWDAVVASLVTPESLIRETPAPPLFGAITRAPSRLPAMPKRLVLATDLELTTFVDDAFANVSLPQTVVCNVTGMACPTPARCLALGCGRVGG